MCTSVGWCWNLLIDWLNAGFSWFWYSGFFLLWSIGLLNCPSCCAAWSWSVRSWPRRRQRCSATTSWWAFLELPGSTVELHVSYCTHLSCLFYSEFTLLFIKDQNPKGANLTGPYQWFLSGEKNCEDDPDSEKGGAVLRSRPLFVIEFWS